MACVEPAAIETKIFNRLAMMSAVSDVHTLEVARRDADKPQRVPLITVEHDGSPLVSAEASSVTICGCPALRSNAVTAAR